MPGDNLKDTARLPSKAEIIEFYTKNKNSLWYRLFMPANLKQISNNTDPSTFYNYYKESFRWINFFNFLFGGFEIFNKLDLLRKTEKIDQTGSSNANSQQEKQLNNKQILKSFLEKMNRESSYPAIAKIKREYISDKLLTTTLQNLDDFSDEEIEQIITIINILKPNSENNSATNWPFLLIKSIIDQKNHEFLSVFKYLVVDIKSQESVAINQRNVKTDGMYLLVLANKEPQKIKDFADLIIKGKADLGTILKIKGLAIDMYNGPDVSYAIDFKKLNKAQTNKPSTVKSEQNAVDPPDVSILLSKNHWWANCEQSQKTTLKSNLEQKNTETKIFFNNFCNKYGQYTIINANTFTQILNLSEEELNCFQEIVNSISEKNNLKKEAQFITKIFSSRSSLLQNTSKSSGYTMFGSYANVGHIINFSDSDSDLDSSLSDATTNSELSKDEQNITSVTEIYFLWNKFKDSGIDILDGILKYNNFGNIIKIIYKMLELNKMRVDGDFKDVCTKLLMLNESQVNDVIMFLDVLSKDNNRDLYDFENLKSAIFNASKHSIIEDLSKFDSLISGSKPLTQKVLSVILTNDRTSKNISSLDLVLKDYKRSMLSRASSMFVSDKSSGSGSKHSIDSSKGSLPKQ